MTTRAATRRRTQHPRVVLQLPSGPCTLCGRDGAVCWKMPCLELQGAIDSQNESKLAAWARDVGVTITRKDGSRL